MNRLLSEIASKLESGSRPKGGVTKEGEIPSLGAEHLDKEGRFDFSNIKKVSYNFYNALSSGKIENNDILIVKDGATTGKVSFVGRDFPFDTATINEHVFRIQIQIDIAYPKYVFHFLRSNEGNRQVMSDFHGATVGGISRKFMGKVKIPLPHLETQKKIAAILDEADELRQNDKKILEKYDQLAQSVFLEMFGDPVRNEKGFELCTIRDLVCEVMYGTSAKASDKGKYPYLRMNNITYGGYWDFSNLKYIDIPERDKEKYLVKKGDILFNRTNSKELVGKTGVYYLDQEMAIAGYLIRVRVNSFANPYYIWGYLNSSHGKSTLKNMCKNIVGMANINAQEMQGISLLKPPIELQNRFTEIIEKIENQKKLSEKSFQKSEELFQSLLQRAFRGELV